MRQLGIGLTDLYNRFNDPEVREPAIVDLRRAHADVDAAVLAAYGWSDLAAEAVFEREWESEEGETKLGDWRLRWPEPVRDEVLGRLLALNAERYAEEQAARK